MRTREQIQQTLLRRDNAEDNPWTVFQGKDIASSTQLQNFDGSNPYVRKVGVTNEMLAYDTSIKITTEVYRVSWVQENVEEEPDANAGWFLSFDGGITHTKVSFVNKKSRVKRSHWWIFLKKG